MKSTLQMIVEVYDYRDLVLTLVARDLKVRYRRSALGFLWTMLQPLLTLTVLHLVFSTLFRFNIRDYPVYALSGILFFNFFSGGIIASMNSLKSHTCVLQKTPVPLAVFPLMTVISGVINLLFALVPLLGLILISGHKVGLSLLFVPVAIFIAAMFTLGAGMLLAPLAVFFNDVVELVGVAMMMLYFLTPIFYPISIVSENRFAWVIRFNPVRSILETFRDPIYYSKIPPMSHLTVSIGIALLSLFLGSYVFRKSADRIPFYV